MNLPSTSSPLIRISPHLYYDGFCYEPIPYRLAVAEGATHVLALRSRPTAYEHNTRPTLYACVMTSLYFKLHGVPMVAYFFKRGGQ